jgi:hypothetical protein
LKGRREERDNQHLSQELMDRQQITLPRRTFGIKFRENMMEGIEIRIDIEQNTLLH